MKKKMHILLILSCLLCLIACDLDGPTLPTKKEIIRAAEKVGAINVDVINYIYARDSSDHPTINTAGGEKRVRGNYIINIEVRVIYDVPQGSDLSNTTVENAIRQLFIDNDFTSNEFTVYVNIKKLPQSPTKEDTYQLPAQQSIIEAVQNFGATSITITTYTVNGKTVNSDVSAALSSASIVIRVNYSYNGLGTVITSQSAVILAIRDLFIGFTNVTASVNSTVLYPLPSHAIVIAMAAEHDANNVRILEYRANNVVIDEFYYGSVQSNTPIRISITYDIGANVNLVEQAVRGLFQHFTNVTITTMLEPPTREEIISELYKEGAATVNIKSYTIAGSNASAGLRAKNVNIYLEANYTTLASSSNGQTAVKNLFNGFTNANIYIGNNIPINLPTKAQISNAIYRSNSEMYSSTVNTYTVNGKDASTLGSASSSDTIVLRIRSVIWIPSGNGWGSGYEQAVRDNSVIASNAKISIKQLFIDTGFNHANNISITFE